MYWLRVLRPASPPSFRSFSQGVYIVPISCTMIEAEMYGVTFSENTAMRCTAPPENMLNMPRMPLA